MSAVTGACRAEWTWVDDRTRTRVSITSTSTREQAERQLQAWRERDAKGGRPDLREVMPHIVVTEVPQHLWGCDPGDVIPRTTVIATACGRCDLPTDPGELIDLDHQPVCQPCAHHLVPELGELDHGRDA